MLFANRFKHGYSIQSKLTDPTEIDDCIDKLTKSINTCAKDSIPISKHKSNGKEYDIEI